MTTDSSRAFFASALLHGVVLAVVLYFTYAATERAPKTPRILELVAGEGDNYGATEAPAVGSPDGVKLNLPKAAPVAAEPARPEPPRPEPPKPEPVKAEPAPAPPVPVKKAPAPVPAPPKTEQKSRTMAQTIRRALIVADSRAKKQVAKEREEEKKRLTKEEFDKAQRAKVASATKGTTPKIEKIDSKGIAKGVVGGSTKNDVGGAGGTALSVEERTDVESYEAGLNKKLTDELYQIPDLKEGLRATAEFEVLSSGRLVRGKIIRSSGNERFDQAVLHAIAAVHMPYAPPKGFDRVQQVAFSSHDKNQG